MELDIQVSNWNAFDTYNERGHIIQAFGRTREGISVCVDIEQYVPSLLVYLGQKQHTFFVSDASLFVQTLKRKYPKETRDLQYNPIFVMKKRMYPYSSVHAEKFMKLTFQSEYGRKQTATVLRLLAQNTKEPLMCFGTFALYNGTNLASMLMMQHERRLTPHGWIRVRFNTSVDTTKQHCTCEYYVCVPFTNVCPLECDTLAPFRIVSFDIECLSYVSWKTHDSIFPNYNNQHDVVAQIGVCTWTVGTELYEKRVFVLDQYYHFSNAPTVLDDGTVVIPCVTECDVLMYWARYIHETDADMLTGYNIFGFDYEYLYERARLLGMHDMFVRILSRRVLSDKERTDYYYTTRRLCSSAYGDNQFKLLMIPGRVSLDMYIVVKKEHKLESYKLDSVAEHFLQQHKNDMKPAELFQALNATRESCLSVASYCIMDCILVVNLMKRLNTLPNFLEMANITKVTLEMLMLRGQQIKCFSLITCEASACNYAVPDCIMKEDTVQEDDKYTGATVLEPKKGVYMDERITVLDFASLYPSLMIAYNLCFSTYTQQPHPSTRTITVTETTRHSFVTQDVHEGILPRILKQLWEQRKAVKRLMKSTENETLSSILNGRQLAIKVTMNSMYGFCGATFGILPCRAIAESITCLGREHIALAKQKVEELYPCTVVYGDSDSIYVHFQNTSSMNDTFDISTTAQNKLNEYFLAPIEIEFEKVYFPFILLTKKRYCALVWETPDSTKTHIEYKGISIIRRDFCKFTRETLDESMKLVLFERNIEKAHTFVLHRIKDLMQGRVDMTKLIMTKNLNAKYSKEDTQNTMPHVAVMVKMRQRDPNNYPKSGERVPFLFITNGERLLKDRAEHPDYVAEHHLRIDYLYYLENQLHKPCKELFDFLMSPKVFDPYEHIKTEMYLLKKHQTELVRVTKNRNNHQNEITRFFSKKPKP